MAACLISGRDVQASSAAVNVTVNNNNVVKGDTVYVIITITSSDEIGGFKGYFSYDNSVLKYVTGGSVASGNDNEFLVSDTDREDGNQQARKNQQTLKSRQIQTSQRIQKNRRFHLHLLYIIILVLPGSGH